MLTGRCNCGRVEIRITGKVGPLVYCHCTRCQRASGSAFSANVDVRTRYLNADAIRAAVTEWPSSPGVWRAFCPRCGSPVYSRRDHAPDILRIRLGLLDEDPGRRALARFYVDDAAAWYTIDDDLPRHPAGPPAAE